MVNDYYRRLAESMTNKILNEAWSDSMPDWMKPRLNATAFYGDIHQNEKIAAKARRSGKDRWDTQVEMGGGYPYDPAEYRNPRNGPSGRSLYRSFNDANIDLQKVEFIPGEPPTSKKDSRIQPPNIGIWNLPGTGQVYAKGINDLEKLRHVPIDPYDSHAGWAFKDLPIKFLHDVCEGQFCYIDGSNIPQRNIQDAQRSRADYKYWEMNNPSLVRNGPTLGWGTISRDRSGYVIVPSSKRLAKKLEALKAKSWSKWFEKAEDDLQELYNDIGSIFSVYSWKDSDADLSDAIRAAMQRYDYALGYYKKAMRDVQELIRVYGENSDAFLQVIGQSGYGSIKNELEEAQSYINSAKAYVDKYVLKYIDF